MSQQQQISSDRFEVQYAPQKNHLVKDAAWDGCMFETYGPELEFIKTILAEAPGRVWTVLDCDGRMVVGSGFHHVNRLGYLITEVACPDGTMIEVVDEDDEIPDAQDDDDVVETPRNHRVLWEIDVDATNPVEAAQAAMSLMPRSQDDENLAKHFMVAAGREKYMVELKPGNCYQRVALDVSLPFNIVIGESNGSGVISSLLWEQFAVDGKVDDKGQASVDALESFLLALACEGVDIWNPQFSRALTTTVDAIANNLE